MTTYEMPVVVTRGRIPKLGDALLIPRRYMRTIRALADQMLGGEP